jgi:hypothetical protein
MEAKMKKLIYIMLCFIIAFLLNSNKSVAQIDNVGTSVANFLKIGIGARAQGMGSAYIAQADEISALYWNPAGISNIQGRQVGFTQIDWISDVKLNFLGGAFSVGNVGHLGVAVTYLSMGEMKVTNWEYPEGSGETFESNDICVGLTWARKLTDRFSVGVQGKYIQEKISNSSASAFALDIGTQYETGFMGMKLGMVLTNFGTKMKLSGRDLSVRVDPYEIDGSNPGDVWASLETVEWPLPIGIRMGASFDMLNNQNFRLTGNFDFNDDRDYKQMWTTGGEAAFLNEMFFIRGGVSPRYEDELRASFGVGFKYHFSETYGIILDYAYSDLGRLENANRFSLAVMF